MNRMKFAGILTDLRTLGRSLTLHERAFLQACEAAGYEMMNDSKIDGTPFFSIENDYGNPMAYPAKARVAPESLDVLRAAPVRSAPISNGSSLKRARTDAK